MYYLRTLQVSHHAYITRFFTSGISLFGASAYYSICKAAFLSYRRLKNEMKNNPYQAFFSPIKS